MQTRSTNYTSTPAGRLSASSNNNAEEEAEPTITRRSTRQAALDATARITKETRRGEYERKRSEIEVNTANLQPHTSNVSLMAAPGTGAGTIGTTEALKKKAAFEALDEEFAPHAKKVKEDLDDNDRKILEACKILAAAETELWHPKARPLHDAIKQQGGEKATAKLKPTHAAASRMQQMTGSSLSEDDIKGASRRLQNNPSETNGDCAFYKWGDETVENKRGKNVIKNLSIVNTAKWEILEKEERGLPDYLAGKSRKLKEMIPKHANLLPHIIGCGVDYFRLAGAPESWNMK